MIRGGGGGAVLGWEVGGNGGRGGWDGVEVTTGGAPGGKGGCDGGNGGGGIPEGKADGGGTGGGSGGCKLAGVGGGGGNIPRSTGGGGGANVIPGGIIPIGGASANSWCGLSAWDNGFCAASRRSAAEPCRSPLASLLNAYETEIGLLQRYCPFIASIDASEASKLAKFMKAKPLEFPVSGSLII